MGYWEVTSQGEAVDTDLEQEGLKVWGDAPADELDKGIAAAVKAFREDIGRNPTKEELRAGLEFALGAYDELVRA